MEAVRDILATLLALVAAVLLALWAPAAWLERNVVDADGFRAVAAPLGSDPTFRSAVAKAGVDAALEQLEVPKLVRGRVEPMLTEQAEKLTDNEAFTTIWAGVVEDLHTSLFAPGGGSVSADLNPYVDLLVKPVGDLIGEDIDIPDSSALRLEIVRIPASPWPARLQQIGESAGRIGGAGLVAAALSLLLAARRGAVTFLLGLFVCLGGLALMLATQGIGALIPASVDGSPVIGTLVHAFEQKLGTDMFLPSIVLMGAGALLIVIALGALGIASSRRGPRG